MGPLADTVIVLGTAALTEIGAWAVHRYIMHGWGWNWHQSHHRPRDGAFEKNDLYAVVFGGLAFGLILAGSAHRGPLYWIGLGVTLYGVLYFMLHDGLVHHRWPFRARPSNPYIQRLVQAHHLHHAVHEREGAVSFGFLYAPPLKQLRQKLREAQALREPRGSQR